MNNLIQWPRAQYWDKPWNPIIGCNKISPACAFRIDETQFSTARFYGGFTYNGHIYLIAYWETGELLAVRKDFAGWLRKRKESEVAKLTDVTSVHTEIVVGQGHTAKANVIRATVRLTGI